MYELETVNQQLPATLPELSKFVLVGREKLNAVRAEIRAIDKVGLAKEVREQKLREAQDIADAVLDAEVRIGELTAQIPKASHDRGNQYTGGKSTTLSNSQTKEQALSDIGITQRTAERFEELARNPEAVAQAKQQAREEDRIVTRESVFQEIKKPHVSFNSGNNEWYTPSEYIEAARQAMGSIDLDPASSETAQRTVQAAKYYTAESNGLDKTWRGNIWMNPPYASDLIGKFISKLSEERQNYNQAVVLVNNATETEWFRMLISEASAVCFPKGRVRFYMPDGKTGAPLQGQAVVYIGDRTDSFFEAFSRIGWGCLVVGV